MHMFKTIIQQIKKIHHKNYITLILCGTSYLEGSISQLHHQWLQCCMVKRFPTIVCQGVSQTFSLLSYVQQTRDGAADTLMCHYNVHNGVLIERIFSSIGDDTSKVYFDLCIYISQTHKLSYNISTESGFTCTVPTHCLLSLLGLLAKIKVQYLFLSA